MKGNHPLKYLFVGVASGIVFVLTALQAHAQYGLSETAGAADLTKYGTNLPSIIGSIVGTALSVVSVVFFILMIFAGFLWMTAHGKEDQEKKARDTIFAAIIGIIIVLAAYAITNLVFNSVKGGGGGAPNKVQADGSQCLAKGSGFDCRSISNCNPATIEYDLCPGGANNVCCLESGKTVPTAAACPNTSGACSGKKPGDSCGTASSTCAIAAGETECDCL